jgi:hypothetical protein
MALMRAKMVVRKVVAQTDTAGNTSHESVTFGGVCKEGGYPPDGSDEDNSFCKWSPYVNLEMHITNPSLFGKLTEGKKFYVDFIEAAS